MGRLPKVKHRNIGVPFYSDALLIDKVPKRFIHPVDQELRRVGYTFIGRIAYGTLAEKDFAVQLLGIATLSAFGPQLASMRATSLAISICESVSGFSKRAILWILRVS